LVAVKLDMSKAYARVEWDFLEQMMRRMGFAAGWINLIMNCVRSVKYRVKINGELSKAFTPGRGLRQGEPLSSYLFIICTEAFSILLQKVQEEGSMKGVKVCNNAPEINHLFFTDDSLIIMKANAQCARKLQEILALYEAQSGQMINKDKSSAFFSKGVRFRTKASVLNALGIPRESQNLRYLGLPVHLGPSKSKEFEYLKEKIWWRIQG
jgi:hypothetical protein